MGAEKRRVDPLNTMRASTSALQRPMINIVSAGNDSRRVTEGSQSLFGEDEAQTGPPSRHSYATDAVRPGSRESSKENMAPVDADEYEKYRREIELLKAEVGTLQYRIQTIEQEREIETSLLNNKLEQCSRREVQEAQSRRAADNEAKRMTEKANALQNEMKSLKDATLRERDALEHKARDARSEAQLLREELNDVTTFKDEALRLTEKQNADLETQIAGCRQAIEELELRLKLKDQSEEQMQRQSSEKDELIARLEADALRFKARGDDMETVDIKKQLSDQVQHIRTIEAKNRRQSAELEQLRFDHRAVEVVEEEKRSMQRKLGKYENLEAELAESRLQRQRLENERLAWSSYLEAAADNEHEHFDSPMTVARALTKERLTTASYVEQLGSLRAELIASQGQSQKLSEEEARLRKELETMKTAEHEVKVDKVRLRLDRQRVLALKEAELLRAQLKIVDDAEETYQPETFDEKHVARVRELETLIEDYKAEVQKLHQEMSSAEVSPSVDISTTSGNKRLCPDDDDDGGHVGQLLRKNRTLQDDLRKAQLSARLLEKDVSACREQLAAAQELNKTRILSLKSNPTADFGAMRRGAVEALRKENRDLLAKLQSTQSDPSIPLVPTSVLNAMEREIAAAKAETVSAQKSSRRLKEVWASKSQEFKKGISSILGWTVTFIPNGKMRVESTFFPSQTEEHENSIVFDGERGTMKVGGGPKSSFAQRISDQIGFWVREKGCVPGFLAALTLEFYEEHLKASKR